MKICYVDESGCLGLLVAGNNKLQPVFVLGGIVLDSQDLYALTLDFLNLKNRFFPNEMRSALHFLDGVLPEIKGSDIKRMLKDGSRNNERMVLFFLNAYLDLLEKYKANIIVKILIKGVGIPIKSKAVYTSHIQFLCEIFHHFLESTDEEGIMIADSRSKSLNVAVAHSIFTQKFKAGSSSIPNLGELPLFGHSENHTGIQLADLLVSTLLFPMATITYSHSLTDNIHLNSRYGLLKQHFSKRLQNLQYRFQDSDGKWRGGISVNDQMGRQSSALLFK